MTVDGLQVVMIVASASLMTSMVEVLLVTAGTFAVLCLATSFLRFQFMAERMPRAAQGRIQDRAAFQMQIMHRLGTGHRQPEPFSLLRIKVLHGDHSQAEFEGEEEIAVINHVQQVLASSVRKGDGLGRISDSELGVVLDVGRSEIEPIIQRLVKQVAEHAYHPATGAPENVSVKIGCATFPENGDREKILMEEALKALESAREQEAFFVYAESEEREEPKDDTPPPPAVRNQSVILDELTGVLKSDKTVVGVKKYISYHRRANRSVSMLYIDLDYLQRYNEQYGKDAGDSILRGVGKLLQEILREDDLIGRYGGEEFLVMMPENGEDALAAAQRVTVEIRKAVFMSGDTRLKATASVGVASCPEHGRNARELFVRAGVALEHAKGKGRAVSMLYDPEMKDGGDGADAF